MNQTQILGHMASDPETRYTPGGQKVTSFRVATNYKKAGKEETIWWRVTVWGDRFDRLMPHLKKGSSVIITGQLQKPEIYTNREGRAQVSLELTAEIINLSPFGRSNNGERNPANASHQSNHGGYVSSHATSYAKPQAPSLHPENGYAGMEAQEEDFAEEEIPF